MKGGRDLAEAYPTHPTEGRGIRPLGRQWRTKLRLPTNHAGQKAKGEEDVSDPLGHQGADDALARGGRPDTTSVA